MEKVYLLILNILISLILFIVSYTKKFYAFSLSMINPVFILSLLVFFFSFGFYLNLNSEIAYPTMYQFEYNNGIYAFIVFTVFNISITVGVVLAILTQQFRRQMYYITFPNIAMLSYKRFVSFLLIFSVSLMIMLIFYKLIIELNGICNWIKFTAMRFVFFHEERFLQYISNSLNPILSIYLSTRTPKNKLTWMLIFLYIMFFILLGARGNIIYLFIIVTTWLTLYGHKFKKKYLILSSPLLILLMFLYIYIFRTSTQFDSFSDFLAVQGGLVKAFLLTGHFALSGNFIVIIDSNNGLINRFPFESLLGWILYPIPREVIPWKPYSASIVFTQTFIPINWELTRSSTTIGFVGSLYLGWGLFGILIAAVVFFLIIRMAFFILSRYKEEIIVFYPFIIMMVIVFYRTGIMEFGGILWPTIFFYCIYKIFTSFLSKLVCKFV